MGGRSKKVTVGYKYFVGLHFVLGSGVADSIKRVRVDKKMVHEFVISKTTGMRAYIDKAELFGGESREGGISGWLTLLDGSPYQALDPYMAGQFPSPSPHFRGVISVILEQMYLGLNPYLKGWDFRVQRLHLTSEGKNQWHDAKSSIKLGDATSVVMGDEILYTQYDSQGSLLGEALSPFGAGHFANSSITLPNTTPLPAPNTLWPMNSALRLSATFTTDRVYSDLRLVGFAIPSVRVTIDGIDIMSLNYPYRKYKLFVFGGETQVDLDPFDIPLPSLAAGVHTIEIRASDDHPDGLNDSDGNYLGLRVERVDASYEAMNPIHIIRECLTDPNWGMGYTDEDIDEDSFISAADIIHADGTGLCIVWETQESIEKFIKKIASYIDAEVFVDRLTGKFKILLVRDDYLVNELPILSPSNIVKISRFKRPAFGDLVNSVSVSYYNMEFGAQAMVTVQDIALVQEQGATINTVVDYSGFTDPASASKAAQRDLKVLSTPAISCIVETTDVSSNFNVGSVFVLTWPEFSVDSVVMRVTSANFGDGTSNTVRLSCTQDVFISPTDGLITSSERSFEDPVGIPSPVESPLVFEIPYFELVQVEGQTQVDTSLIDNPDMGYIGVAARRPTGGINARMFTDAGAGFAEAGLLDFCPSAKLQDDLGILTSENIILTSTSSINDVRLGSWFQLDEELLSVETISGSIISVKRGVLDTLPAPHLAGTVALFWDDYSEGDPTEYVTSDEVEVKLATVSSGGQLPLAYAVAKEVILNGRAARPYPAANVELNGSYFPTYISGPLVVTWASRNRLQQTSGVLTNWTDGNITAEASTTYNVRIKQGETVLHSEDGIVTLTSTFSAITTGVYDLEITVLRGSLANFTSFTHTFIYATVEVTSILGEEAFGTTTASN